GSGVRLDGHDCALSTPNDCRSTNSQLPKPSINNPLEEPLVGVALAEQPIRRPLSKRDVPFVAIPGGRNSGLGTRETGLRPAFPPGARCTPGAGTRIDDSPIQTAPHDRHAHRLAMFHLHADRNRMAKST